MEDAVRALQQQMNALMSQNAALEAQLVSQQNIAQGLAELPGAITTVLSRSQAPTRRMLVDPKGLGKPPVFSGREEHFYVWTKKVENYVSGVFPNVRRALTFAAESQDVVTAATVAIGVPELGVETSAEIDGQLFVALSALTEGESFDIVMSAGGDHASCTEGGIRTQRDEHEIQKFQEEHMIHCEMMWMVTRQWCRGCQIFILNPVQDRSLNMS